MAIMVAMLAGAGSRAGRVPVLAKYEMLEELGHGGMATVYRAHDKRLLRDVAIKVLHPHLRESREIAHRFSVEAKAVAKLRHRNIVEVYDISSEDDPEQYLVVELVRGPTLRKVLQQHGALPPEIGAAIVLELLSGIGHAHASGVIHRDVKPENVLIELLPRSSSASQKDIGTLNPGPRSSGAMLSSSADSKRSRSHEGERISVKLTDFGIAKLLDAQGVTSTGQVLGSPAHMAPEQIEGGEVDGRADVFGLGVLFYECIVGHLPFLGNNPAQVLRRVLDGVYASAERERPTVGKNWSQILDSALARKPEARYPNAEAMRDAIASELARLGVEAPRRELEAWLDDPEGWTAEHDKRLIVRLCELGANSRKQSNAVAAAADYNRALAYAPNDPSLLRIVASMHRSEARARLVRRLVPLVLGAAVLGSGAYFVAKALKSPGAVTHSENGKVTTSTSTSQGGATASLAVSVPPVSPSASASAPEPSVSVVVHAAGSSSTAPVRVIAGPVIVPGPKSAVTRTVRFVTLEPNFGVHMTIDGAPAPDPDPTKPFKLDDKPHTLVFSCSGELCTPKTVQLPGGDAPVDLSVKLDVPPARLLIDGDPGHSYGVTEIPTLVIAGGAEVEIPMVRGSRDLHVFDRTDSASSGKPLGVTVHAGKRATVSFRGR